MARAKYFSEIGLGSGSFIVSKVICDLVCEYGSSGRVINVSCSRVVV